MNWSVAWSLHKRHAALKVFWELFDLLDQALFNHWLRNSVEAGVAAHEDGLVESGGEFLGEILRVCVLHAENRSPSHFLGVLSQESGAQTCWFNILLFLIIFWLSSSELTVEWLAFAVADVHEQRILHLEYPIGQSLAIGGFLDEPVRIKFWFRRFHFIWFVYNFMFTLRLPYVDLRWRSVHVNSKRLSFEKKCAVNLTALNLVEFA